MSGDTALRQLAARVGERLGGWIFGRATTRHPQDWKKRQLLVSKLASESNDLHGVTGACSAVIGHQPTTTTHGMTVIK